MRTKALYEKHRERILEKARSVYASDPEKFRKRSRQNRRERPEAILASARASLRRSRGLDIGGEQRIGKCQLCPFEGILVPDHDHETGRFRGWILQYLQPEFGQIRSWTNR